MNRKILSLLLVLAIIASMCLTAFAGENEIIIDTSSKEYTETGGGWSESSLSDAGSVKTRYSNTSGASSEWRPNLKAGSYTVSIFKVSHETSDKKAKVEVFHANGVETKTINYAEGSSGWVELGTFSFNAGTSGYVKASKVEGYLRTGSVKFVAQGSGSGSVSTPIVKTESFTDIADSQYKVSIEFLAQLSLIKGKEQGKFEPTKNMTRAEFSNVLTGMLGLESGAKQISTKFSDVPETHWASGYIAVAEGLSIIKGYEDGTFKPEDSVTYNQAIKMLVNALGYEIRAQSIGEYPNSWITVASELGILSGTKPLGEQPITREMIAKLVDNALDIDLLIKTNFGNEPKYEAYKGKNLLTENLDYVFVEGQITANSITSLGGNSSLRADEIELGRIKYKIGATDAAQRLGQVVTAYVTDESKSGATPTIIVIKHKNGKNITTTINADQFENNSTETDFYYLKQNTDTKSENIKISKNADMIYNGKAKTAWSKDDFNIDTGSISFLDIDGDDEQDVIFVRNFRNLIVKSINAAENTIYFEYETLEWNSLKLDPNDNDIKYTLATSDGNAFMLKDLKKWDILSVARSIDKNAIEAIVSQNKISGIVEENEIDKMVIDGVSYTFAQSLINSLEIRVPKVGDEANYFLDFEGKVAAVDYNAISNKKYAYLVALDKEIGLDAKPLIKLFTDKGEMILFKAADKIKFNTILSNSKNILTSPLLKAVDGNTIRQLITYNTNSNNQLNELNTAIDKTSISNGKYSSEFSKNVTLASTIYRGGQQKVFSTRYLVREETKLFLIPTDVNAEDDSLYRIYGPSYFVADKTYSNLNIYDVTKDSHISAIVQVSSSYITNSSPVAVITKVTEGINAEGSHVAVLYAMVDGKEIVLKEREEGLKATFKSSALTDPNKEISVTGAVDSTGTPIVTDYINVSLLKRGDVIQYMVNPAGELDFAKVFLRGNTPIQSEMLGNGTKPTSGEAYSDLYYGYGRVKSKITDGILFAVPAQPTEYERVLVLDGAKFYLIDSETERVTVITKDEIVEDDMVFIRMAGSVAKEVVVYR